jgi:hypothetical protein
MVDLCGRAVKCDSLLSQALAFIVWSLINSTYIYITHHNTTHTLGVSGTTIFNKMEKEGRKKE